MLTMKVVYQGPASDIFISSTGHIVAVGDSVDVPAEVGAALVAQGGFVAETKKSKDDD